MESGNEWFAIIFSIDRVKLINARFGYATGDKVLLLVRNHLKQSLAAVVRIGNRSVLLPISATSIVFPVAKMHSHPECIRRIDEFISGPSCG